MRALESHEKRPLWVTLSIFAVMEAGYFIPLYVFAPDVLPALGYARVALINMAAAAAMVAFLHHAHTVEEVACAEARGETRTTTRCTGSTGHRSGCPRSCAAAKRI